MEKLNMFSNAIFSVEYRSRDGRVVKGEADYDYASFIDNIKNGNIINTEQMNKIILKPNGDDVDKILCGFAPIWKYHESKELFEKYYTLSEMMRMLYANEHDDEGNFVPIYVTINNEKFIVTWEATKENDIFHYRSVADEELGLLTILSDKYKEKCVSNILVEVADDDITLKKVKGIYQHMSNLDFDMEFVKFNTGA